MRSLSVSKMLLLLFPAFCVLGVTRAFFFPPPHLCTVGHDFMECICKNRENITVSTNLKFELTRIVVDGCGTVTVPLGAATHLQLDILSFTDIDVLDIRPFALIGTQSMYTMIIEDVRDLRIQKHGFVGLVNVTNISIKNISSASFSVGAFGGVSNVEMFHIESSNISEVQETAFLLTNITSFVVTKSRFRSIGSMSFLVHNGDSVLFQDCEIYQTSNNSFSTSFVTSLSFVGCDFGIFASTSVVTKDLETFTFKDNTVTLLETDAFSLVDASDVIIFTHNAVKIPLQHSLIPSTGTYSSQQAEMESCCNYFPCNCSVQWLWEPDEEGVYDYLLNSSYCITDSETRLSTLLPVTDSSGLCKLERRDRLPLRESSSNMSGGHLTSRAGKGYPELQLLFEVLLLRVLWYLYASNKCSEGMVAY